MKPRWKFLLACAVTGFAVSASAAPITLDKSEAVADARRDVGSGICGSITKFVNQPSPLVKIDEAVALLNKPMGDPNVVGRVSRLFQNMNFTVGPGSEADFFPPSYNEEAFPYCEDPNANPMGSDDNNIAMRLRGYLNVADAMNGQPQTLAIKCDDGCMLLLGKSRQLVIETNDDSPTLTGRRARWVSFRDPGLYPVELVYYQNATTGYMEWSRAPRSVFASDDLAVNNVDWGQNMTAFSPLTGADLYSSIVGSNPACIECGDSAPAQDCSSGNYCGDGLCQACNVADHCGPSCQKCPADKSICSAGKCVQCTSDAMCPAGSSCDVASGTCLLPCASDDQCGPSTICRPDGFCSGPPTPCTGDAECPANFRCDTDSSTCRNTDRYLYEGGLHGCSASAGTPNGGAVWIALLGFLSFALFRRKTHARRAQEVSDSPRR